MNSTVKLLVLNVFGAVVVRSVAAWNPVCCYPYQIKLLELLALGFVGLF